MRRRPVLVLLSVLAAPACKTQDERAFENEARIATKVVLRGEASKPIAAIGDCLSTLGPVELNLTDVGARDGSEKVFINQVRHLMIRLDSVGSRTVFAVIARPDRRALSVTQERAISSCTS